MRREIWISNSINHFQFPTAAVKSGLTEAGFYGSSLLQSNIHNNKSITGTVYRPYHKHISAEDNIFVEEVKYND